MGMFKVSGVVDYAWHRAEKDHWEESLVNCQSALLRTVSGDVDWLMSLSYQNPGWDQGF